MAGAYAGAWAGGGAMWGVGAAGGVLKPGQPQRWWCFSNRPALVGSAPPGWLLRHRPQASWLPPPWKSQFMPTPKRELTHAEACCCVKAIAQLARKPTAGIFFKG